MKSNSLQKEVYMKDSCCPKILIVDDDEFNIHALSMVLKEQGFTCDTALHGKDAIQLIEKKAFG